MLDSLRYAYLLGDMFVALVWLPLFLYRKDLRVQMLVVGIAIGVLAPVWELSFLVDYWHPQYAWFYGLEDFLYGFFAGGIVSVVYEEVFGKRIAKRKNHQHRWLLFALPFFVICVIGFYSLVGLGLNSIYAAVLMYVAVSLLLCWYRTDLFVDAIMSGFLFATLTLILFLVYVQIFPSVIIAWWELENLSGILVFGYPIEELLWAYGMGMLGGPMYEFFLGLRFQKKNSLK